MASVLMLDPVQKRVQMAMPSSTFVLMYASLARAPEFAMTLASRMAAQAFEHRDIDGVQRWISCYHQLNGLYDDDSDDCTTPRAS